MDLAGTVLVLHPLWRSQLRFWFHFDPRRRLLPLREEARIGRAEPSDTVAVWQDFRAPAAGGDGCESLVRQFGRPIYHPGHRHVSLDGDSRVDRRHTS